jgi:hypothetical protein
MVISNPSQNNQTTNSGIHSKASNDAGRTGTDTTSHWRGRITFSQLNAHLTDQGESILVHKLCLSPLPNTSTRQRATRTLSFTNLRNLIRMRISPIGSGQHNTLLRTGRMHPDAMASFSRPGCIPLLMEDCFQPTDFHTFIASRCSKRTFSVHS